MDIPKTASSSSLSYKQSVASSEPPEISRKLRIISEKTSENEISILEEINKIEEVSRIISGNISHREGGIKTIDNFVEYLKSATIFFEDLPIKEKVSHIKNDIINNISVMKEKVLKIKGHQNILINHKKEEKEILEIILNLKKSFYNGLQPPQDISLLWLYYYGIQEKIVFDYRSLARSFAQNYNPSFSLEPKKAFFSKNIEPEQYSQYSQYKENIENMNRTFLYGIVVASEDYNRVLPYMLDPKNIPPLWDENIPEPVRDFAELQKYKQHCASNIGGMLSTLCPEQEKNLLEFQLQKMDKKIKNFEIELQKSANDMMALLIQEEEDKKQKQVLPLSSSSVSRQSFTPAKIETSDIIPETATSSEPPPEEQRNQKLHIKWNDYFKRTDYRKGDWSGQGGISIPLMKNYFSLQMQFTLSPKEVMAHLKRRHPKLVKELAEIEKKDIEDADGFKSIISSYTPELHNLIFEIASQLSQADTMIYRSSFHKDAETGEIINNPTIMVKGKNEAGEFMLSAWGLYEAEKQDGIKLHLLSYYKEDTPNRILPKNAMKISDLADKVKDDRETEPKNEPSTDEELSVLFADNTSLQQKAKKGFDKLKKAKVKPKTKKK